MRWLKKTNWQKTEGTITNIYVDGYGRYQTTSVIFTYKVDGHWYSGTDQGGGNVGDIILVKYDPADPGRNNLSEQNRLLAIVKWVLFAIGIIAIVLTDGFRHF